MKEFKSICPKCKSSNIECTDENIQEREYHYICNDCNKSFDTKEIEIIW